MPEPSEERVVMDDYRAQDEDVARCQHCPNLADERSYMCEDCAFAADKEVDDLREQLRGAVDRITALEAEVESLRADAIYESEQKDKWKRRATDAGGR